MSMTSPVNFERDRETNFPFTGYKERIRRLCHKVEIGDKLLYYIIKIHKFGAICTFTSQSYIDRTPHWDDPDEDWPVRLNLSPDLVLPEDKMLDVVPLVPSLSFITQKQRQSGKWGAAFMGSLKNIPQQDFEVIEAKMRSVMEPTEEEPKPGQVLTGEKLEEAILQRMRQLSPKAFENLIAQLWWAKGYKDVRVLGHSGDGGIDGDFRIPLLEVQTTFQAKRYAEGHNIGPDLIRQLKGSMVNRYDRGIFVTTSNYTAGANEEAEMVPSQVILVNGKKLVRLLLDARLGVKPVIEQAIIDENFFNRLEE